MLGVLKVAGRKSDSNHKQTSSVHFVAIRYCTKRGRQSVRSITTTIQNTSPMDLIKCPTFMFHLTGRISCAVVIALSVDAR
jgi:hypothetical protein